MTETYAEWGRTPLTQRRQAPFWLFTGMLIIGLWITGSELFILAGQSSAAALVTGLLLGIVAVAFILYIYWLDVFTLEPPSLLAGAMAWGGIVAIAVAGPANSSIIDLLGKWGSLNLAQHWGAAIAAPPVEESLKLLGVIVIVLLARRYVETPLDGMVYGAMAGLGFQLVEDATYMLGAAMQASGAGAKVTTVLQVYLLRVVVTGVFSHAVYTAISGLGVGYYVSRPNVPRLQRLAVAVGLFLVAMGLHFLWNSPLLSGIGLLLKLVIVGVLAVVLYRLAVRAELRWVGQATASGLLTEQELKVLGSRRARRKARRHARKTHGPAGEQLVTNLQRTQIEMAVRMARGADRDDPSVRRLYDNTAQLREELDANRVPRR